MVWILSVLFADRHFLVLVLMHCRVLSGHLILIACPDSLYTGSPLVGSHVF